MARRATAFAVIAPKDIPTRGLVSALRAAGAGADVVVAHDPALGIAKVHERPIAVFTTVSLLDATLEAMGDDTWRVFVLNESADEHALQTALNDVRIGGCIAWGPNGGRGWELRYIARRLLAPAEAPPHMGALLGWGATTIAFRPRTTEDQRATVNRIEAMCDKLGVARRLARAVSTAAHELTMNAMYDAPVDENGQIKYALDRTSKLSLEDPEIPTLRFTLSADFIALDIIDPFGRLPRHRWYEAVLRGHRNVKYERLDLDTTHGGAGLGLHTLYTAGSILRAEITPHKCTHVSWILDRNAPAKGFNKLPRSLYFLPYLPDQVKRRTPRAPSEE